MREIITTLTTTSDKEPFHSPGDEFLLFLTESRTNYLCDALRIVFLNGMHNRRSYDNNKYLGFG